MTTSLPVLRRSNPLTTGGGPPIDPVQRLRDHVETLNNHTWVRFSGKLYYVASRTKADGTTEHYVDRHI